MNYQVSIVIIGRNEEQGIGACVGAARAAAEKIGGAEIIYVDSASTDNTVQLVRALGVRVLSLKPDWPLSPSAGRFIGAYYAQGDFILFLDADTLVYEDFLPAALDHFSRNPEVGGINGQMDDLNDKGELLTHLEQRFDHIQDVLWLRGPCCFYRAAALRAVGSFNPYLISEEEAELGMRIIKNRWKLRIIPVRMACHTRNFDPKDLRGTIAFVRREFAAKRFGEDTKAFVYSLKEGYGLTFLWTRLKTTIIFTTWIVVSCLALFLPENFYPKTVFAGFLLLGGLAIFIKKRSLAGVVYFVCEKIVNLFSLISGFYKISLKNGRHYPVDAIEHPPI